MVATLHGGGAPSPLTGAEAATIEARVKALEARAGTQVVAAVVERSDVYHGLRWRAFALAVSLAGLGVGLLDEVLPSWPAEHTLLLALVLGAGAAAALAATVFPGFARLFLEPLRADAEVRRRAESLFLERELFGTRDRTALLLLASGFEQRAAVYADRGLRERVPDAAWTAVTARMNLLLAAGRTADALLEGLAAAETLLAAPPASPGGVVNELPDRPIVAETSR
ncbi:MAG: TPM domain-containing protein [Candidatus Methylomirabilia bacterium]